VLGQHVCFEPHAGHGHVVHEGEVKYCLQVPDTQVESGPQVLEHPPQCSQLVAVSKQPPPQSVVPAGQAVTQPPMEQLSEVLHGAPQLPQLCGSVIRSVQLPMHISRPGLHTHWPPTHRSGWLQGLLQEPQVTPLLLAF
jgi:hypothetical protein